ncbi:hypothetical protein [Ferruginibacter profundus]
MKKYKIHQWLPLLFTMVIFSACNKKDYPENNVERQDKFENVKAADDNYTPPPVITIADELAKSNKDGEMFYDNEYGYRYWKFCDGRYYLDAKYESGAKPDKRIAKRNTKKHHKRHTETDYAHE